MRNPYETTTRQEFGDQGSMFDTVSDDLFSRKTDSPTSKEAVNIPKIKGELLRVKKAIQDLGRDFTARELSDFSGLDYIMISKRLSVLKKMGYVIKSDKDDPNPEKRNGQMVWRYIA